MRYREKAESDNVNNQIWLSIFSYADEMGIGSKVLCRSRGRRREGYFSSARRNLQI